MGYSTVNEYDKGYEVGWANTETMDATQSRDYRIGFREGRDDFNAEKAAQARMRRAGYDS